MEIENTKGWIRCLIIRFLFQPFIFVRVYFMDILKTDVKKIFFRYLYASFGSALIVAIYSIVDVAMVGQYEGDNGAAALAVFAPIWNIIYSIGMLFGIGGSVLFSKARGALEHEKSNIFFTSSFIALSIVIFIVWVLSIVFEDNILYFFGLTMYF